MVFVVRRAIAIIIIDSYVTFSPGITNSTYRTIAKIGSIPQMISKLVVT